MSDQLLGQTLAHLYGLGHLFPEDHVKSAVFAIYKYNFKERMGSHKSLQRGYAYQDEAGIWCRNAAVQAKRRVWDCRAVYGGTVRLPAYERYRRRMEYEKAELDVEEMTEIEADPGTLVETETAPVENLPIPFWRRWIHYGLTISVSLLLLLLAWLGFRQLRRMAREKNER